jgi:uncharacterized protein (TIGR03067 family)
MSASSLIKAIVPGIMLVAVGLGMAVEEPKADALKAATEKALETFAGTWEIVVVKPEGVTKEARKLVFHKDRTYAALDGSDKELWSGTFDLDPTTMPKVWDHRSHESRKKGGDTLGIYELHGDTLKVCCVVGMWKDKRWMGKPRPTEFKPESWDVMLELRRVRSEK